MKYKKGKYYRVKFWDHSMSSKKVKNECQIVGKFIAEDDVFIYINLWLSASGCGELTEEDNAEYANIIKSTIIKSNLVKID